HLEKGVDPRTGKPISPTIDTVKKLAAGYGVDEARLLRAAGLEIGSEQAGIAALEHIPLKPIPILGTIHAGASSWAAEIPEGWTAIPEAMARTGEYFALRVRGDCFAAGPRPVYDGDLVIVRAQETVENGQAAIVLWPDVNEAQIRRVYVRGDQVTLTADNPAYPPITVATTDVRILGLVVGYQAELAAAR